MSNENRNYNITFIPTIKGVFGGNCSLYATFFKYVVNHQCIDETDERIRPLLNELYNSYGDKNIYYKYTILTGMLSTCLSEAYNVGSYIPSEFSDINMGNYKHIKNTLKYHSYLNLNDKLRYDIYEKIPKEIREEIRTKMKSKFPKLYETVLKYRLLNYDNFWKLLKISEQNPSMCSTLHGEYTYLLKTMKKYISSTCYDISLYSGEYMDIDLIDVILDNKTLKEKMKYVMNKANISDMDLKNNSEIFNDDQLMKDYINIISSYYDLKRPMNVKKYDTTTHMISFFIYNNPNEMGDGERPCNRLFNIMSFIVSLKVYYKKEIYELENYCEAIRVAGRFVRNNHTSVNEQLEFVQPFENHAYDIMDENCVLVIANNAINMKLMDNIYMNNDNAKILNNTILYCVMYGVYKNHDSIFDSSNNIFLKNMSFDDLLIKEFNFKDTLYPNECLFMEQQKICKRILPKILERHKTLLEEKDINYICDYYPLAFILFDTLKLRKIWLVADINVDGMLSHTLIDELMINEYSESYCLIGIKDYLFYFHGDVMTKLSCAFDEKPKKMTGSNKNKECESRFTNEIMLFMLYLLLTITIIIVLIIMIHTIVVNTNKTIYEI